MGNIKDLLVHFIQERSPRVLLTFHFYSPLLYFRIDRYILPIPTAFESRVDREQTLVAGIHGCPDIEVAWENEHLSLADFLYDNIFVLALLEQVLDISFLPTSKLQANLSKTWILWSIFIQQALGDVFVSLYRIFRKAILSIKQLE